MTGSDHEVQPNNFLAAVTTRVGRSASKGSDTSGKVWSVYLSEAERQDRALAENWKADTDETRYKARSFTGVQAFGPTVTGKADFSSLYIPSFPRASSSVCFTL